jgi:sensor histidine kinase regulating citrate/malate metabolism
VLRDRLLRVGLVALLLLALGALGAGLISRRLRRLTHGLGAAEITRMYEYYDSVLHAVHEGLILLDRDQRVQLVNDEGRRLLGLPDDGVGRPLHALGLPEGLTRSLATGSAGPDEIHLVDDRVLVVNQAPAYWQGRELGSVVTLRDHTELRAVSGELDTVKSLSESLHAQNHEAANRLHTVVSLIELGRSDEALEFATAELESAQSLADKVSGAVADSVVPALLLGKTAQASERGIQLVVDPATRVEDPFVRPGDVVTLVGNLLDNAFDAVVEAGPESPVRRVEVAVVCDEHGLRVDVGDSGPGLAVGTAEKVFERGWSTKRGDAPAGLALGRGLGLALVGQVARRYGGRVYADTSPLGGAAFHVDIPRPAPAAAEAVAEAGR